jgi:hypothetical protein
MPHRLHLDQFGPIHALPVLHYTMEFASLAHRAVERVKPDCIAVELPPTLQSHFQRGISRLPEISVLRYEVRRSRKRGEKLFRTVYLLIEPADPLVEAARLALERDIPLACVDVDLEEYPRHGEPFPDSYAVQRIGLGAYYREYLNVCGGGTAPEREDLLRERGMAFRLQELAERHERILFVCGMAHLERVKGFFDQPQAAPLERVRREGIGLFNLHPDSCPEILGEYPFLSSLYELRRGDLPPEPAREGRSLRKSYHVFELINGGKDIPEDQILYESVLRSAHHAGREGDGPDRQRAMLRLFREAARHYRQETGEPVHLWQKRAFFRFSRNYAFTAGRLLPDFFQMLASARGCVDDNFAYAFWRLAGFYPWQRETADLPTISLRPEDIADESRRIRFRPRSRKSGKGLSHLQFLKRKREKRPGEWLEGFDDPSVCSYPPEDLIIEDYGRFLKKKGAKQLSEEQSRVEPFSSSMLDGIDMRETLRNLHEGKIYVRESLRVQGGVGSVVVIFDEDRGRDTYPYLMTWLGEHDQESDMALYATQPADNVVGPGICRSEYGGFLLSYPPRRMYDVWRDEDYSFARGKAEVLLLAALDYSREKHVVYVAARPPRSCFRQIAARLGKKIVHIPLGSLSPLKLKRLRVFHVLFGRNKREIAGDYIW